MSLLYGGNIMKYKIASIFSCDNYQIIVHYDCTIDINKEDLLSVHKELLQHISIVFNMLSNKLIIRISKNKYYKSITVNEGDYRIIDKDQIISILSKEMFVSSLMKKIHLLLLLEESYQNGLLQFNATEDNFYYQKDNESKE